ncbi:MAG: small subunit ribosomal protein S17 [Glomeribacter sp. 1016415]|uniref:Small ribosomal subunit protein uS17 n=1 Tax=Mycoavidus cysteinexigens TaxID=1553431 RepID=A0A2Z6ESM4_9BURK|nr:30S ribosomal protein S17 [Mycoavidus cysteinexigens]MCX8565864.1 small subunit ribosomal protein S17 [Glomeribacter sp. 1016415]BBE08404.1 30S ribosomal protein S17 [Mycoavidus cysteinexigens]GAM52889.1 SSU ribosomal protein S17p [bacterium endosymbiont of Mortierella elongata FMR23-6]GLR00910.1 30S ribosomal protein S17 [Mycoavidus cysteinexigens]
MNDVKTSLKRTLIGRVISNKMDKTVTVLIERRVKHPLYGKFVVRSKKYHAHDDANTYNEGDLVEIQETRPLSKTKAWAVSRLMEAVRVI